MPLPLRNYHNIWSATTWRDSTRQIAKTRLTPAGIYSFKAKWKIQNNISNLLKVNCVFIVNCKQSLQIFLVFSILNLNK